ncbi:hypothetical protein GCM10008927_01440 [Amylibacter ulvae]|uniref:Uncharacterized protein n=1 Tax=Paramylibacter ulvae TaxID=1651968 RepID=A0ABQ3CU51_9RHOB|nr:hypothetical protein [Amylibacter ulvae]GHA40910.1 hypothetical protein GCM10008927_01440 [Amylibacter ulvae]
MAFSNPKVYLEKLARPLLERFEKEPNSYELAVSCSIILYHYCDVVAYVRNIKPYVAAKQLTDKVSNFEIIRALANAGKHVELTHHPNKNLLGLKAQDLQIGKGAAFSDGTFFSDGTSFDDSPDTVMVTTPDGETYDVLLICNNVLENLEKEVEFYEV